MTRAVTYISSIQAVYRRYGAELALNAGASPASISSIASALSDNNTHFDLDPTLAAMWSLTDGSRPYHPIFARPGFLTGYDLLSVSQAINARETQRSAAPQYDGYEEEQPRDTRIRPGWFQHGWLPFGSFGGGSMLLILDLSPSEEGTRGQVITYTHDPDQIDYVASGFSEFLSMSRQAFEEEAEELLEGVLDELDT